MHKQPDIIRDAIVGVTAVAVVALGAASLFENGSPDSDKETTARTYVAKDIMKQLRMGEKVTAQVIENPVTVQKAGAEPKTYPVSILLTPGESGSLEGAVIGVPVTTKKGQDTIKAVTMPATGAVQTEVRTNEGILYMSDLDGYSPAPNQRLYIMDFSTGRTGDLFTDPNPTK